MTGRPFQRRALGGIVMNEADTRAELIDLWSRPDTRRKLLEELAEKGYGR